LVDKVQAAWDEKQCGQAVFIDICKAFDCVNFDILLGKIEALGVRGVTLKLLSSYLKGRKHFVSFKGTNSNYKETLLL
jgi:hypothetical protein